MYGRKEYEDYQSRNYGVDFRNISICHAFGRLFLRFVDAELSYRFYSYYRVGVFKRNRHKMIIECVREKKKGEVLNEKKIAPIELFVQAIATSIDALSVGVLYIAEGISKALISFSIIGGITAMLSFAAFFLGKKFGAMLKNKACIVGGVILIIIGLEIFIESFFV